MIREWYHQEGGGLFYKNPNRVEMTLCVVCPHDTTLQHEDMTSSATPTLAIKCAEASARMFT